MNVYLTVDVECSLGGSWGNAARYPVSPERRMLCRNQKGEWGVRFLASELDRYSLRATFFAEVFAAAIFGEDALRPVICGLLDAGQDVQLHLHPIFLRYAECRDRGSFPPARIGAWPDAFSSYTEQEQERLIVEGAELFHRISGCEPIAFRAGSYMANRSTLRCLARAGILLDSSANAASPRSTLADPLRPNQPRHLEGVWEFPITVAGTQFPDSGPLKHLEISALSFSELQSVLLAAHLHGIRHLVLIFHSFSTVKARDVSYDAFRPNRIVIRRLQSFFKFLAANPGTFKVRTFADLSRDVIEESTMDSTFLPRFGLLRPVIRKAVQAVNHLYWI